MFQITPVFFLLKCVEVEISPFLIVMLPPNELYAGAGHQNKC
jgi:hypothetical protein